MNKAFLSIATMIVTGFIIKSYCKLKQKPATKEEIYRAVKREANRRKREEMARLSPRLDSLRPSNDLMDSMAMASNGCAMMGVAR